jgi:hypothetical protein
MQLGYKNASGYKNINWVQEISTNAPLGGAKSPYNDPQPPDDNLPFYWTNKELPNYTNTHGYNSIFNDSPIGSHGQVFSKFKLVFVPKPFFISSICSTSKTRRLERSSNISYSI